MDLEPSMIDHTGIIASDFEKSKVFYSNTLAAIGYDLLADFPASITGHTDVAGFGEPPKPDFWVIKGTPNKPPVHVVFRVGTRAFGDAFYKTAIAAGGRDNGAPGSETTSLLFPNSICDAHIHHMTLRFFYEPLCLIQNRCN
jgi:catechol 2,3-dioxygenase-like lactoylglutathione lyase family enzyme